MTWQGLAFGSTGEEDIVQALGTHQVVSESSNARLGRSEKALRDKVQLRLDGRGRVTVLGPGDRSGASSEPLSVVDAASLLLWSHFADRGGQGGAGRRSGEAL